MTEQPTDRIKDCAKCGDDAMLVSSDGKHVVRIRRITKCKFYHPRRNDTCRTEICDSAEAAITQWNEKQALG